MIMGRTTRAVPEDDEHEVLLSMEEVPQPPLATTTTTTAQVLTLDAIAQLSISHLDAGDVLEVYYLARATKLASPLEMIPLTKATLGLRYRPPTQGGAAAAGADNNKPPQELTLEFGARRTANDTESIPTINDARGVDDGSSIAWDNTARIYYREKIDNTMYQSATYLGSMSGTVVRQLLVGAVEFAKTRGKRYQPWTIVYTNATTTAGTSTTTGAATTSTSSSSSNAEPLPPSPPPRVLLKSMRDTDFISFCIQTLAGLGVQLRPVITPLQKSFLLHASSIQKVQFNDFDDKMSSPVVEFYAKLYDCLESIGRADYSRYVPPTLPPVTHAPTVPVKAAPTRSPTVAPTTITQRQRQRPHRQTTAAPTVDIVDRHRWHHHDIRRLGERKRGQEVGTKTAAAVTTTPPPPLLFDSVDDESSFNFTNEPSSITSSIAPSTSPTTTTTAPSASPTTIQHKAEMSAAQQKEAVVVIHNQASTMAQAALLSNDANAAANIIRTCFTDARFGLPMKKMPPATNATTANNNTATTNTAGAVVANNTSSSSSSSLPLPANNNNNENGSNRTGTVLSYIYWDGSHWYQVELVPPYISVATSTLVIPAPPIHHTVGEDMVDYAIVLLLLAVTAFGALLLLQQVLGRSISLKLYRYQRWFFHPTKYSLEDDMLDFSDRKHLTAYQFGREAIPLSMGGQLGVEQQLRQQQFSMEQQQQQHELDYSDHDNSSSCIPNIHINTSGISYIDDMDELEMVETSIGRSISPLPSISAILPSFGRALSLPTHETDSCELAPNRLFRDPNLVDLPNLSTLNTKIAVPVSSINISTSSG
jgi:hypothetical protein